MIIIIRRGVQSSTWKTKIPPKSQIPIKMTKLKSWQNFQSHLKSNFLSLSCLIYALKSFLLLLISIYFYQSTNRSYICSHLFIHSYKGGLTRGLLVKQPLWEYINKLKNTSKITFKKITCKIYAKTWSSG